jgi:hypothetical protein
VWVEGDEVDPILAVQALPIHDLTMDGSKFFAEQPESELSFPEEPSFGCQFDTVSSKFFGFKNFGEFSFKFDFDFRAFKHFLSFSDIFFL